MTQKILRRRGERFIMEDSFTTITEKATVNPTFATPKTGVTYTVYPIYEQKERICGYCKHWNGNDEGERGRCENPSMGVFVETNPMPDEVFLFPRFDFGCILWEAKESEGGET